MRPEKAVIASAKRFWKVLASAAFRRSRIMVRMFRSMMMLSVGLSSA
jgi:hypothetical protein